MEREIRRDNPWLLEDDFGLDAGDNLKFLSNIIEWLSFEI